MLKPLLSKVVRSPLLWGGIACFCYYALIHKQVITNAVIVRYTSLHPIEYAIMAIFFVGMASLVIKNLDVRRNWARLKHDSGLEPMAEKKLEPRESFRLKAQVDEHVKKYGLSLQALRLRTILNNIRHSGNAERLDDDLRTTSDDDYIRAEGDYGLAKIIIWAVPILGFLGTVIGIAVAMGNLSPDALEESLPSVMAGLSVAFDTTGQALALSMILYFTQFATWRNEQKMLDEVSQLVDLELRGRFVSQSSGGSNEQLVAVRVMIEVVLDTLQDLIQKQAEIWDQAISVSHSRYAMMASECATQMKTTLALAMRENVDAHAKALVSAEHELMQHSKQQVREVAQTVTAGVTALNELQSGMVQQSETLREIIAATGDIAKLETQLNRNLSSLAEARYFEETLNSLAAAIHLLSSKQATQTLGETTTVKRGKEKGQAA